jgi:hypothetical protein
MIGLNVFLKPPDLAKLLVKGIAIPRNLFSAAAGIISAGPIYAWYPVLKDLREKGGGTFSGCRFSCKSGSQALSFADDDFMQNFS